MKKQRFRIVSFMKDDKTFYEAKVRTWFGWISFSVFYKSDIVHIYPDPQLQKNLAYESINQYCRIKGFEMKDVVISEIKTDGLRRNILLQKIYTD